MLRSILGVIVGYISLGVVLFLLFTIAWLILGPDGSYKPASWEVSTTWLIMSFAVGLVAAIVGGIVCMLIARNMTAVWVMCAILLLLSAVEVIGTLATTDDAVSEPRPDEVKMMDAMAHAEQPTIAYIVNPILGVIGVVIGAKMVRRKKTPVTAA